MSRLCRGDDAACASCQVTASHSYGSHAAAFSRVELASQSVPVPWPQIATVSACACVAGWMLACVHVDVLLAASVVAQGVFCHHWDGRWYCSFPWLGNARICSACCMKLVVLGSQKVVFMSMGTLVMGNLLRDFITDPTANMDDRLWIYQRYGTAYYAMYTLYEITFAGAGREYSL